MNKSVMPNAGGHAQELETRMARFGLRVAAGLSERNEALPQDITERLRVAREQAVERARSQARAARAATAAAPAPTVVVAGHALAFGGGGSAGGGQGGGSPLWLKLVSILPLLMLVLGLIAIQHGQSKAQIHAAAEVDTALLSDNVPPAAYSDPGFSQYLADEQQD